MRPVELLRRYLEPQLAELTAEAKCTCGAVNHARVRWFRVNGLPTAAVIPESRELTAEDLSLLLGARVEPLLENELEPLVVKTELGPVQPAEKPFVESLYLDRALIDCDELVFCPRMFFGERGECFRVPTTQFVALTRAIVRPLVTPEAPAREAWAV